MTQDNWTENIILVDADHIDKVAFNLIVNFERMIGRRIPQADMARWIDCIALDGGLREGDHQTTVVLIHDRERKRLENFEPADFEKDLNGKAFKDRLGEFTLTSLAVEPITTKADLFIEVLQLVCAQKEVKRIMVIAGDDLYDSVRKTLWGVDDEKRITVFSMEPREGGNFRQEILGFSLMAAMGIKSDEIKAS